MEPIVLVGGGENHYRLIQKMAEISRPVILVSQNIKVLPKTYLPFLLKTQSKIQEAQLDLWTACQRKGVYFLEDQVLSFSREEKTLNLKKFGKLKYHKLSVENPTHATCLGRALDRSPIHFNPSEPYEFIQKVEEFVGEVHKHCPREVRVVCSGYNLFSLQMAFTLQEKLAGGCESTDILIIEDQEPEKEGFFKSKKQKDIQKLKGLGIRVIQDASVIGVDNHLLKLGSGQNISYDVLIPCSHFRATDVLGKILQFDAQKIMVQRSLSEVRGDDVYVTGENVQFEREATEISNLEGQEIAQVLYHNIFEAEPGAPLLECREKLNSDIYGWNKSWEGRLRKSLHQLKQIEVLEPKRVEVKSSLEYQAQHMSRPWQGFVGNGGEGVKSQFRLNSFNGFNSWGSFALSGIKITEIAILKSLAKGIKPRQLRFNLTLPNESSHLLNHIFESTFRGIESVVDRHQIEIDGGDTFDGKHWHLNVTVGGECFTNSEQKFRPHDYLLITRPLGFGFLWAGRLHESFDSKWIQNATHDHLIAEQDKILKFIEKWDPSGRVLIEEWGFLYHCLQKLPAHQQLMVNLREVPRWTGTDYLIDRKINHPGLDINWQRVSEDLAFNRDEVSLNNSVLWDSLSQGSLVFGVKAENWQEALCDLEEMGYKQAALVGCIRPKTKGNRVVLSDWSPS